MALRARPNAWMGRVMERPPHIPPSSRVTKNTQDGGRYHHLAANSLGLYRWVDIFFHSMPLFFFVPFSCCVPYSGCRTGFRKAAGIFVFAISCTVMWRQLKFPTPPLFPSLRKKRCWWAQLFSTNRYLSEIHRAKRHVKADRFFRPRLCG